jgi:hypothetical protein
MCVGLAVICTALPVVAQQYWGRVQRGANVDETLAVTGDAAGNTYAAGYYSSTAQISGTSVTAAGLTDVFVSRTNANGTIAWVATAGGAQSDRGLGITTDPQGNVLVCGFFTGTIQFGGGVSLSANGGSQDAFVAKYKTSGAIQWARAAGSPGSSDRANAIATDAQGNVYIAGQYSGEAAFGAIALSGARAHRLMCL